MTLPVFRVAAARHGRRPERSAPGPHAGQGGHGRCRRPLPSGVRTRPAGADPRLQGSDRRRPDDDRALPIPRAPDRAAQGALRAGVVGFAVLGRLVVAQGVRRHGGHAWDLRPRVGAGHRRCRVGREEEARRSASPGRRRGRSSVRTSPTTACAGPGRTRTRSRGTGTSSRSARRRWSVSWGRPGGRRRRQRVRPRQPPLRPLPVDPQQGDAAARLHGRRGPVPAGRVPPRGRPLRAWFWALEPETLPDGQVNPRKLYLRAAADECARLAVDGRYDEAAARAVAFVQSAFSADDVRRAPGRGARTGRPGGGAADVAVHRLPGRRGVGGLIATGF